MILEAGKFNIFWDTMTNAFYVMSFILIPLVISSNIELIHTLQPLELIIDIWLIADVAVNFFTSYTTDVKPVTDLKTISLHYLTRNFIFDFLGTVPGLVTIESVEQVYYFKILRFVEIDKFFKQLRFILEKLGRILTFLDKTTVENILKIVQSLFALVFLIHVMA